VIAEGKAGLEAFMELEHHPLTVALRGESLQSEYVASV
jgi:hypothetical protein